jgi:hypothetical protein
MTKSWGVRVLAVIIGFAATTSVYPARGFTVTGLPPGEACLLPGGQAWSFEARWNAFLVDAKPWPRYILAASGCVANTPVSCAGTICSYPVTCGIKVIRTAAHVLPTGVTNAAGQTVRTSSTVVGWSVKPSKPCK